MTETKPPTAEHSAADPPDKPLQRAPANPDRRFDLALVGALLITLLVVLAVAVVSSSQLAASIPPAGAAGKALPAPAGR